jgi:integrase
MRTNHQKNSANKVPIGSGEEKAQKLARLQDETDSWPFVRWIKSRQRWQVDSRTAIGGTRKFFKTKDEAVGEAIAARMRLGNEGRNAFDEIELRGFGWTVADAIKFALQHLRRESTSVTVAHAIEQLLKFKEEHSKTGEDRRRDIKNRLAKFKDAVGAGTKISLVTNEAIGKFLSTISTASTRNDYRKEIVMLWGFAKSKGWVAEPLDKNLVPRAPEPEKARTILSVDKAAALMLHSTENDIRALNALVLFGGCRREEVEKMDWSHIDFENGHINITAEISKVRTERFAPINETLKAWLLTIKNRRGSIVTRNLMRPLRKVWEAAGVYPWPQDAHRHSFISYRRTQVGDAITALEAGTSESIIKRHYKRPVSKEAAEKFFAILPAPAGKVIPITAAA